MGSPQVIQFASLGMADSLILMVLALVVFGPRRLPQIGRQIGKLMYEFRKASNDFKYQMEEELRNSEEADRRKKEEERLKALALAAPAQTIESGAQVSESQVSEARPGATTSVGDGTFVANGEARVASPYPGEIEYPAGVMAAEAEAPAEEPYPRIQPPATGEQVQADGPSAPTTGLDADPAATTETEVEQEQAQGQPSAATEPVANHG
jgi:sec-independent protein translocase protein TatB